MKFLKYAVLPIALSSMGVVQAKGDIFYTVPFHNVEVKAASKIYIDYNFNAHTQTLVCSSEQSAITSAEWVYKDATRKIDLPITLKDDIHFDGYYADPYGKLVITNEFGTGSDNGSIFVSCEYRNMK